ncbi:MAG: ABC transporter permease subunit, partial [Bacilli bacterium]|nr:ABC transporter permease subunit [Bacilli bacterium]
KVALGPLIIIWIGAGTGSIIFMALMISLFVSIINIYNGFNSTNKDYITLLKSLKANKKTIFLKVVLPSNKNNLINTMKVNVSMTLIGVIMGELLVSKKGLGYLIMYGSQVFNINLVITSIFILGIIAFIMYEIIVKIEKKKSNQL